MSANTSQRQLQNIVLGSDVADFATWRLVVTCRGCCALSEPRERLRQVSGQRRSRVPSAAWHHLRHGDTSAALHHVRQPGG